MKGTTYKRCGCRNPDTGKPWGTRCPRLRRRGGAWSSEHGIWHYQAELPQNQMAAAEPCAAAASPPAPRPKPPSRKSGSPFSIADPADDESMQLIADAVDAAHHAQHPLPSAEQMRRYLHDGVAAHDIPLVGDYLDDWLASRRRLAAGTRLSYASHIRVYFKPLLGHLRLDRLRRSHITALFDHIEERNQLVRTARASDDPDTRASVNGMQITGPTTMHRIRGTLRKALNDAIRQGLITSNPATLLELPSATAPKPVVWTPSRVQRWRTTGKLPGRLMVWTPELTGQFLDPAADDELYALYHLIALRGLRRGEACGLPWTNIDLDAATLTIDTQIVQVGWDTAVSNPKSQASKRTIPLDRGTVDVLRAHHQRQPAASHTERGLVFTRPDGSPWHPAEVTDRFQALRQAADLPPIRLHDLRHGAATIALAAGADMKTVQELLGHASYHLTANTYTSVLPEYARNAAEHAAALIPRHTA